MDLVLGPEVREFTHNYIDDLLIASPDFSSHLLHLRAVLQQIRRAHMTLNLEKSFFVRQKIHFLGHILTSRGIYTDPEKVKAIRNFPTPKKVKQLRAFLGLVNYYRRFCQNSSMKTARLTHLLRKGAPWNWENTEDAVLDSRTT